jgi:hypothetical protein
VFVLGAHLRRRFAVALFELWLKARPIEAQFRLDRNGTTGRNPKRIIMKNISTVFILFFLLTALAHQGWRQGPGARIENILNECAQEGKKVDQSSMNAVDAAFYVANKMEYMDVSSCPQDFRAAFRQHIEAWRALANHLSYPSSNPTTVVDEDTFQSGKNIALNKDFNSFYFPPPKEDITASLSGAVNSTYLQLIAIAEKYGARIHDSAIER